MPRICSICIQRLPPGAVYRRRLWEGGRSIVKVYHQQLIPLLLRIGQAVSLSENIRNEKRQPPLPVVRSTVLRMLLRISSTFAFSARVRDSTFISKKFIISLLFIRHFMPLYIICGASDFGEIAALNQNKGGHFCPPYFYSSLSSLPTGSPITL